MSDIIKCNKCGEHALECWCENTDVFPLQEKESYNIFNKMLKEMPPGKIEIIPHDPKDQEIADQLNELLRHRQVP